MRNSHICGATWRLMHCTMEPYFMVEFERARLGRAERQDNVGRNPQLPPRLEALQPEPDGTPSARRSPAGRIRHQPIGPTAHRRVYLPHRMILCPHLTTL